MRVPQGPSRSLWAPKDLRVGPSGSLGARQGASGSVRVPRGPSGSLGVRQGPSGSVRVPRGPSASLGVRQDPSGSVRVPRGLSGSLGVRQGPSGSVEIPRGPSGSLGVHISPTGPGFWFLRMRAFRGTPLVQGNQCGPEWVPGSVTGAH